MAQPVKRIFIPLFVLLSMSCAFFEHIISPSVPTAGALQLSPTDEVSTPTDEVLLPTVEALPSPTQTLLPASVPVSPTPTLTPDPTPSPSPQSLESTVIIGGWELLYNPSHWEEIARENVDSNRATTWGEPGLIHHRFEGCLLRINLGMGVPSDWRKDQSNRMLGNLELQVEAWTDGNGIPVLTVYHYPPDNWEEYWRLELVIEQNPHACIEAAEALIANSPGPIH